jgi:hypothetical protein
MKLTAFIFLFTFSLSTLSSEVVTITTVGKDDFHVRLQAKNQLILNSLDKLPSIIWGEESIEKDIYTEQLLSIGYAYADISIITETFDRNAQTYTLNASVDFNKDEIMATLSKVADGQFALATLDKIRAIMGNTDLSRYIDNSSRSITPLHKEASLYINPYFYAQTHTQLVNFHDDLLQQFAYLLVQQTRAYLSDFSVTLVKVTKDHFTYQLMGPDYPDTLTLTSPELQSIYDDYADEIKRISGGICLFTPLGNRFFNLPNYTEQLDVIYSINQEFAPLAYPDFLYRNDMQAFEFVLCDGATKESALELRVAHNRFIREEVD